MSLPSFIKLMEGMSWRETFKLIHKLAGVPEAPWEPKRTVHPKIPPDALALADCSDDSPAVQLLESRHVKHLRSTSYLCIGGKFHERIIFPTTYLGELTGFEAKGTHPNQVPKSLYMPGMQTDQTVYTTVGWKKEDKPAWAAVTESVIDAETFHGWGYAIGCYGGFKHTQVDAIVNTGARALVWFLDGDAWPKVLPSMKHTWGLVENWVVPMPLDQDPNSLGPSGCRELVDQGVKITDEMQFMDLCYQWGRAA